MNTYLWLVRREFWERHSIWLLPVGIAVVGLLLTLFGSLPFPKVDTQQEQRALASTYLMSVSGAFFLASQIQIGLYLLDCLYEDRRDRSVLFWKSLPVSDTETVLSKVAMAVLVIPAISWLVADLAALLIATIVTVRAHEVVGSALWQGDLWWQLQVLWLYVIVTTTLWYLPVVGWFLVVSAGVKRAPILWSLLPFLVLNLGEALVLRSNAITHYIANYMTGYLGVAFTGDFDLMTSADLSAGVWHILTPGVFLSSGQMWAAVLIGVALIVVAIQLRMRRTES